MFGASWSGEAALMEGESAWALFKSLNIVVSAAPRRLVSIVSLYMDDLMGGTILQKSDNGNMISSRAVLASPLAVVYLLSNHRKTQKEGCIVGYAATTTADRSFGSVVVLHWNINGITVGVLDVLPPVLHLDAIIVFHKINLPESVSSTIEACETLIAALVDTAIFTFCNESIPVYDIYVDSNEITQLICLKRYIQSEASGY